MRAKNLILIFLACGVTLFAGCSNISLPKFPPVFASTDKESIFDTTSGEQKADETEVFPIEEVPERKGHPGRNGKLSEAEMEMARVCLEVFRKQLSRKHRYGKRGEQLSVGNHLGYGLILRRFGRSL